MILPIEERGGVIVWTGGDVDPVKAAADYYAEAKKNVAGAALLEVGDHAVRVVDGEVMCPGNMTIVDFHAVTFIAEVARRAQQDPDKATVIAALKAKEAEAVAAKARADIDALAVHPAKRIADEAATKLRALGADDLAAQVDEAADAVIQAETVKGDQP